MSGFKDLADAVINGDFVRVREITLRMIDDKVDPLGIINDGLIAGMNVVGIRFKAEDMYVPEVMMSAKSMAGGMELLKPLIAETDMPSAGTIVIGTVKGDLHDIGKSLVCMILESAGFKVFNLGTDICPEMFVQAVRDYKPQIVGLSALLTTTMLNMKSTIELLIEAGLRDSVKVIVGGAPVSQSFADEIGADGYSSDAMAAKELCLTLVAN
ncbi:putative cobalamin binding protein [Desulfosporosinus orientis DSM 765]|uniref:Putative cobalamin binding protein n=1 Tax=Desulfosporosinus orientis (strain ATCC 19365 / DSM 765 / NCIMB 8382 / VKM B-1628 / Singapore I) TaxID=768706 RepID=G7WAN7_DESOD|nr:corrinoid protein [Desulfosporosinus orientis]AET66805.1 putative cobalamin binding protein [Desulfosporosinus orientis DSM 765]